MTYRTLISIDELRALQVGGAPPVLLDCSFELGDPGKGERGHAAGHLPGSVYVHLERDLSGPKHPSGARSPQFTGRHPLPVRGAFAERVCRLGIKPGVQVVTFDGEGGVYAARAWWMLRWIGHENVAVLDGGIAAWVADGGVLTTDLTIPEAAATCPPGEDAMPTVDATTLAGAVGRWRVLDARGPERFRGETEALDPVAGHIPGASNRFFKLNLQADGRFKPAPQLREEFVSAFGASADTIVHQCGSGVTACHNLLAMAHAGLEGSILYPGSWSEWCADPTRPVATG